MDQTGLFSLPQDFESLLLRDNSGVRVIIKISFDWRERQTNLYRILARLAHQRLLDSADTFPYCKGFSVAHQRGCLLIRKNLHLNGNALLHWNNFGN